MGSRQLKAHLPSFDFSEFDENALDYLCEQFELGLHRLHRTRKAIKAVDKIRTQTRPRKNVSRDYYPFVAECRYSPKPDIPDLSRLPIDVYTNIVAYLTTQNLKDLFNDEGVFDRCKHLLASLPLPDWKTFYSFLHEHDKEYCSDWAETFLTGKLDCKWKYN